MNRNEIEHEIISYLWLSYDARIYNSQENKLNYRTISGYFISYLEKFKSYMFYCPNHITRFMKIENTRFLENCEISGSDVLRNMVIKKV